MNPITNLTPKQLRQAADLKERIDSLQEQLEQLLGGAAGPEPATTEAPKGRKRSAATIAKMRQAQKERWARIKGAPQPEATPEQKPKRKFSTAGRKALSLAAKARWAKAKAAGKSSLG